MTILKAAEIAEITGGTLKGNGDIEVSGVASLREAEPNELSFLGNQKYRKWVTRTSAGVVLLPPDFEGEPPQRTAWVYLEDPNSGFSTVATRFAPEPYKPALEIHPSATVSQNATIGQNPSIGAHAVICDDVIIGDNVIVEPGCFIGPGVTIGDDCRFYSNVSIRERSVIGNRAIIHCNAVIGSDGYGYEPSTSGHKKVPQVGIVQLDDDVEIGACTTIDRARFGKTWLKRDVKVDNQCQIAHNVVIDEGSFLMAQVGIAGSTTLGKFVAMFGKSGAPGHVHIGDFAKVMGNSGLIDDLEGGEEVVGFPAQKRNEYFRQLAAVRRLPEMLRTYKKMERRLAELEERLDSCQGE